MKGLWSEVLNFAQLDSKSLIIPFYFIIFVNQPLKIEENPFFK